MSTTADTDTANLFELSSSDSQVTYSTGSLSGPPLLSYAGPKGERQFSGAEIDAQRTALGTEVTVTLESIPDLHTLTLTLVLPDIHTELTDEQSFHGVGILTTNHTTIAGPPSVTQSYRAFPLDGVAKRVVF